jgi:hypothetical protein
MIRLPLQPRPPSKHPRVYIMAKKKKNAKRARWLKVKAIRKNGFDFQKLILSG